MTILVKTFWNKINFVSLLVLFSGLWGELQAKDTITPFSNIVSHTGQSFAGWNLSYHGLSVLSTYAIIEGDLDEKIHKTKKQYQPRYVTMGALIGGTVYMLAPGAIYYYKEKDYSEKKAAAAAMIQAIGVSAFVTTLQKIVTGRKGPVDYLEEPGEEEFSRTNDPKDFQFSFWNNFDMSEGRFFWPSGHTATTMAGFAALMAFYPHNHWIKIVGVLVTSWMAFSMVDGSHHWFSDIPAGALIGYSIGNTIGKGFRKMYLHQKNFHSPSKAVGSLDFNPIIVPGFFGFYGSLSF